MKRVLIPMLAAAVHMAGGCTQEAEPRWLVRALPGGYPEVVYFVPTTHRRIALTIDDGLDSDTTPAILDVLKASDATATFFPLSNSIAEHEPILLRILADGHEIGHHMTEDVVTVSLDPEIMARRFNEAADILEQYAHITWFRPGSGRYNNTLLNLTRQRGYRLAMASVAPLDTLIRHPRRMAGYVNRMVKPGSIVVLHDAGDRGRRTAETLELLLPRLRGRGYDVVSLSRLDSLADPHADD